MASESVNAGIPWLHDLILHGLPFEDPERVARAAANVTLPLAHGVKAIGKLMASAAANKDDPPDPELLSDVGFLLEIMGDMIDAFGTMEANANYQAFDPSGEWARTLLESSVGAEV